MIVEKKVNKYLNKLYESLLLEYSDKQIQAFKDKFGDENYDLFIKSLDRLKKDGQTTDIQYYLSNKFAPEKFNELITKIYGNLDIENKPIPTPKNTKQLLYNEGRFKVWFVTDYTDMIELSEGTGDGDFMGERNTGWCIGGRYNIPYGQVKVSQAKYYFELYKDKFKVGGFIVLETPKNKFCIIARDGKILNITDNDDNDHADSKYINRFIQRVPIIEDVIKQIAPKEHLVYGFYAESDYLCGGIDLYPDSELEGGYLYTITSADDLKQYLNNHPNNSEIKGIGFYFHMPPFEGGEPPTLYFETQQQVINFRNSLQKHFGTALWNTDETTFADWLTIVGPFDLDHYNKTGEF